MAKSRGGRCSRCFADGRRSTSEHTMVGRRQSRNPDRGSPSGPDRGLPHPREPSLKASSQQAERRRLLEETISRRFDYREMSKRTLASHWSRLTDVEREEFVDLFKNFLSDRYAGKIAGYSGEKVHYLGERLEGQFAEVRTKLVSNKVEIPMDYRLINKDRRWYAYDIIADGVSLVKNYRSQFDKIIGSESYAELTKRLRNRTVTEGVKKKRD